MRYQEITEAAQPTGMLAVKAALAQKLQQDLPEHDELVDQWGIMDDLWLTDNGGIALFRSLRLKEPWLTNLKMTGHRYWATSRVGAAPYDGPQTGLAGTVDVEIGAEIDGTADVDWNDLWATILALHHVGENELRLDQKGVPLKIFDVWVGGTLLRRSPLRGKIVTS